MKLLNLFKKIKPGYYILTFIFLLIYFYNLYSDAKEYKLSLQNKINNLLTYLKNENYFKFQDELNATLKHKVSVEDIKNYAKSLNLDGNSTFLIDNITKRKDNLIAVRGMIVSKDAQKKAFFLLQESNKSFSLINSKIENLKFIEANSTFPIK